MPITLISSGSLAVTSQPAAVNITGIQAGDLIIAAGARDFGPYITPSSLTLGEAATSSLPASGWGYAFSTGSSFNLDGLPGNTSFGDNFAWIWMVFRGVDSTNPFNVTASFFNTASNNTQVNPPSITTTVDGCLILAIGALDDDVSTVSSTPSGYTYIIEQSANSEPELSSTVAASYKLQTTAGIEDPGAYTFSSADLWTAFTIALNPSEKISIGDITLNEVRLYLELGATSSLIDCFNAAVISGFNLSYVPTANISLISSGSYETNTDGSSFTISNIQAGDMVIVAGASDSQTLSAPTGFTDGEILNNINNSLRIAWFYTFSTGTSVTVSGLVGSTSTLRVAWIWQVFRGVDPISPINVSNSDQTGSSTTVNPPSITTSSDGCAIIAIGGVDNDSVANSVVAPSGYDLIIANQVGPTATAGSSGATIMSAYIIQSTAGSEDPGVFTKDGTDDTTAFTFALKPTLILDRLSNFKGYGYLPPSGITFIAWGSHEATTDGTSFTITGIESGDLVILAGAKDGGSQTITDVTNFTFGDENPAAPIYTKWWYNFSTGSSMTVSGLSGDVQGDLEATIYIYMVFRGVNTTSTINALNAFSTSTESSSLNPPSITTTTDNCMIVTIGALDDDSEANNITAPSLFTFIGAAGTAPDGATSNGSTLMSAYYLQPTAGSIDPDSFTTEGFDGYTTFTFALTPI